MKAYILTFHFAHNYGAVLQCYALQKKMEEMGYESEIINYRPKYHTARYSVFFNPYMYYKNIVKAEKHFLTGRKKIIAITRSILANRVIIKNIMRKHNFDCFLEQYLVQGKKCTVGDELAKLYNKDSGVFITGSDQVWNKKTIHDDYSYFLDFTPQKTKKIAYAVSMGDAMTPDMREISEHVKDFLAISLREKTHAETLSRQLDRKVESVLDPTLLIGREYYEQCEKKIKKIENIRYILVYNLEYSEMLKQRLSKLLEKNKNLIVVNISRFSIKGLSKKRTISLQSIGPGEFLTCIKDAQYILTDSFHGTVFSIIYHKKFWAFENKNGSLRLKDLLTELGLYERFISRISGKELKLEEIINYDTVDGLLMAEVQKSGEFLKTALMKEDIQL